MIGSLISAKYRVVRKLGQGGMGTVYQVRHVELDATFALKLLPNHLAEDPDLVARFQREARVMARLRHDHIVKVFDFTRDENLYYLLEEFIDGEHLGEYLKRHGPLPATTALEIARQLADALAYAHERGVIHRDIKPSNVLIDRKPPIRAVLTDFGIAKVEDDSEKTRTGLLLGTVRYAAPEQAGLRGPDGRHPVDRRADVFALGLVLFEMCEGRQFFSGLDETEIIGRLVYERDPLLPSFTQPVPRRVTALITRAIARHPGERQQSMTELLRDLGAALDDDTLDPDKTMVNAPLTESRVTDDELEARIRSLQAERERRLALAAQAQAVAARDEAAGSGAPELAPATFRDGIAVQEQAAAGLNDSRFLEARDLFERAAQAFTRAAAEAGAARLVADANSARMAMIDAKRNADETGAANLAATAHDRARKLERQAEEHLSRQQYEVARSAFEKARDAYVAAEASARLSALRTNAESARQDAQQQREVARERGAEQLVPVLFRQAVEHEARADGAFANGDFAAARELFVGAGGDYQRVAEAVEREIDVRRQAAELARQQAEALRRETQRKRELARATQSRAATARDEALAVEATELAPASFRRGKAAEEQAINEFSNGRFQEAGELFEGAVRAFVQSAAEATAVLLARTAGLARAAMVEAKRAANHARAADRATTLYDRARVLERRSEQRFARKEHESARAGFEEARDAYVEAEASARAAAQTAAEREAQRHAKAAQYTASGHDDATRQDMTTIVTAPAPQSSMLVDLSPAEARRSRPKLHTPTVEPSAVPAVSHDRDRRRPVLLVGIVVAVLAIGFVWWNFQRTLDTTSQLPKATMMPVDVPAVPPLAWKEISPAQTKIRLGEGEHQNFTAAVEAANVDYDWFLDGERQAGGQTWRYEPSYDAGGNTKTVRVVATVHDRKLEREWRVEVTNANRPPFIASAAPAGDVVQWSPGQLQEFAVAASDPDRGDSERLTYTWELDGSQVASGSEPSWVLRDLQAPLAELRVRVTDESGAEASAHSWKVARLQPTAALKPPPRWISQKPAPGKVSVEEGASVDFAVRAEGKNLSYTWRLDGAEIGHGPSWKLKARAGVERAETHTVQVDVADANGQPLPLIAWSVEVLPVGPKIVDFQPQAAAIISSPGEVREFVVKARSPAAGALRHEWIVDGERLLEEQGERLRITDALSPGEHTVEVAALDTRGLRSVPRRWTVTVQTAPAVAAAPTPVAAEPIAGDQISEAEARQWLVRYREAWQQKDADALEGIGAISHEAKPRVAAAVRAYGQLRVYTSNEAIQIDGNRATISFDRTDEDETGRKLPHERQTYRLQKGPNGVSAMR